MFLSSCSPPAYGPIPPRARSAKRRRRLVAGLARRTVRLLECTKAVSLQDLTCPDVDVRRKWASTRWITTCSPAF